MTEGPYKLPPGWRWVKLGEVARTIESGFAFGKRGTENGDLLHLRPYNIGEDGTINLTQQFLVPRSKVPKTKTVSLKPGDVVFNNTNSVELVGKAALVTQPLDAGFSNHITLIRTNPEVEGAWLTLALRTMWQQGIFARICNKWIGQAGINTDTLKTIRLPLPPLSEQRRIVARVEELMERVREAKRLREEAKEDADRLIQAALAEVFPRPGDPLPPGWKWVKLEEVCGVIMGQSPPSKTYNTEKKGLPFFQGKADFGELYPTPRVWCSSPQKIAQPGDILISVRAPVGPTNLANVTCCIGRGLAALRVTPAIERKWLLYYLRNIESDLSHRGSGSTFSAITKKRTCLAWGASGWGLFFLGQCQEAKIHLRRCSM